MPDQYRERRVIEWTEDIRADQPEPGMIVKKIIGKRRMRAEVEVIVDVQRAAFYMGCKAMRSKGRKSVDGYMTVKALASPIEVSREGQPWPSNPPYSAGPTPPPARPSYSPPAAG